MLDGTKDKGGDSYLSALKNRSFSGHRNLLPHSKLNFSSF